MAHGQSLPNRLQQWRTARGWTQEHLARLAGVPRSEISAIERQRLTPSVQVALLLAQVLGCTVEELFPLAEAQVRWAWPPPHKPWPCWQAQVGSRRWLFPTGGPTPAWLEPDLVADDPNACPVVPQAANTLVVASCDPQLGRWHEPLRALGVRLLALEFPSREALRLLVQGAVHAAGVHFATPEQNAAEAALVLQEPFVLVDVARWEETIALAPGCTARRVSSLVRGPTRWLSPPPEAAASEALQELLGTKRRTRRTTSGHRHMAWALKHGWGQAGVCLRSAAAEMALRCFSLRWEHYQLCVPQSLLDQPPVQALLKFLRSGEVAQVCEGLPGVELGQPGHIACQLDPSQPQPAGSKP